MSSVTSHTAHSERPERSRNAKAQARHRAKRKAYIEQLEQTVTKLQTTLGFSTEDVAALPPPMIKIRELELEVARLEKENEDLRGMLSDAGARSLPTDIPRRNSLSTFQDARPSDRDYKRRRMVGTVESAYMSPSDTPPQGDSLRPPPLTIPQPVSHHYSYLSSSNSSHSGPGHSPMFSLHATAFQMPTTPSGSSSASSPPFSPAQMQEPHHSPAEHRPPMSVMSSYGRSYVPQTVKVEDDHYTSTNHHHANNGHYPMHTPTDAYASEATNNAMPSWHGYSTDRAHMHR